MISMVAAVLFDTYLKQIFEDQFFHADPHPGNLFVTPLLTKKGRPRKKPRWQLTFVDFGMVGQVPDNLRAALRETAVAVGTRDAARMIRSYKTLGFLLPEADTEALEGASAAVFDRFWGMSMSELRNVNPLEMHRFAMQFRELMYEMPFQLPHDLLLLGRTIAILSGMCTGLDPDFNVWQRLAPHARKMIEEEGGSALDMLLDQVGEFVKALVAVPDQMSRVLTSLERGQLTLNMPLVNRQIYHLEGAVNRLVGSLLFSAFFFGGVLLVTGGHMTLGYISWGFSVPPLLWTIFLSRGHSPWAPP